MEMIALHYDQRASTCGEVNVALVLKVMLGINPGDSLTSHEFGEELDSS